MDKAKLGYKDIDKSEKPDKVNNIFPAVSDRYDLMND